VSSRLADAGAAVAIGILTERWHQPHEMANGFDAKLVVEV